jgi:hypothetical protein
LGKGAMMALATATSANNHFATDKADHQYNGIRKASLVSFISVDCVGFSFVFAI